MKEILCVGFGGALGSMCRYGAYLITKKFWPMFTLPLGTFTVNMLGCLAIGYAAAYFEAQSDHTHLSRLFFITGFLGGFTTFSAFGLETWHLFQQSQWITALSYVGISFLCGVAAVWVGYQLNF